MPIFYAKTDASRMSKGDLLVLAHYALVCCEELDTMTARDLNNLKSAMTMQIVGASITQKLSAVMLGRAFACLGFERKTVRNIRGYVAVRRSPEEMRTMRQQMTHTNTDDTDVF